MSFLVLNGHWVEAVILAVTFYNTPVIFFYSFFCNQILNKHHDLFDWFRLWLRLPGGGILCTWYRRTEDQWVITISKWTCCIIPTCLLIVAFFIHVNLDFAINIIILFLKMALLCIHHSDRISSSFRMTKMPSMWLTWGDVLKKHLRWLRVFTPCHTLCHRSISEVQWTAGLLSQHWRPLGAGFDCASKVCGRSFKFLKSRMWLLHVSQWVHDISNQTVRM